MSKIKKDAFIILRVPKAFKDLLEKKSEKLGINLSKYIRQILENI